MAINHNGSLSDNFCLSVNFHSIAPSVLGLGAISKLSWYMRSWLINTLSHYSGRLTGSFAAFGFKVGNLRAANVTDSREGSSRYQKVMFFIHIVTPPLGSLLQPASFAS